MTDEFENCACISQIFTRKKDASGDGQYIRMKVEGTVIAREIHFFSLLASNTVNLFSPTSFWKFLDMFRLIPYSLGFMNKSIFDATNKYSVHEL
jgi:hypothetical protein